MGYWDIPPELAWLEWVAGSEITHVDPDDLVVISAALREIGDEILREAIGEADSAASSVVNAYPQGDGGAKMTATLRSMIHNDTPAGKEPDHGSIELMGNSYKELADAVDSFAGEVHSNHLNAIFSLGWLAVELAWALSGGPAAPFLEAGAIAATRLAFRTMGEWLASRIARMLGQRFLSDAARRAIAKVVYEIIQEAAVEVFQGTVQEVAVQGIVISEGLQDGWRAGQIWENAWVSALAGGVGGGAGAGFNHLLPRGLQGGGWRGALGGGLVGIGAGLAGATAAALATGQWDPRAFTGGGLSGAGPSAAHGYRGRDQYGGGPMNFNNQTPSRVGTQPAAGPNVPGPTTDGTAPTTAPADRNSTGTNGTGTNGAGTNGAGTNGAGNNGGATNGAGTNGSSATGANGNGSSGTPTSAAGASGATATTGANTDGAPAASSNGADSSGANAAPAPGTPGGPVANNSDSNAGDSGASNNGSSGNGSPTSAGPGQSSPAHGGDVSAASTPGSPTAAPVGDNGSGANLGGTDSNATTSASNTSNGGDPAQSTSSPTSTPSATSQVGTGPASPTAPGGMSAPQAGAAPSAASSSAASSAANAAPTSSGSSSSATPSASSSTATPSSMAHPNAAANTNSAANSSTPTNPNAARAATPTSDGTARHTAGPDATRSASDTATPESSTATPESSTAAPTSEAAKPQVGRAGALDPVAARQPNAAPQDAVQAGIADTAVPQASSVDSDADADSARAPAEPDVRLRPEDGLLPPPPPPPPADSGRPPANSRTGSDTDTNTNTNTNTDENAAPESGRVLPEDNSKATPEERARAATLLRGIDPDAPNLRATDLLHGVADSDTAVDDAKQLASKNAERWANLSDADRALLIRVYPSVIGKAPGIDAASADAANRRQMVLELTDLVSRGDLDAARIQKLRNLVNASVALEEARAAGHKVPRSTRQQVAGDLADVLSHGDLNAAEKQQLQNLMRTVLALQKAQAAAAAIDPDMPVRVIAYDSTAFDGSGSAAIAFGNPDTATQVAWHVLGKNGTLANVNDALAVTLNQHRATLPRLRAGESAASIAWLGYDAPTTRRGAFFTGRARAGAELLLRDLAAFNAAREATGERPSNKIIAHGYGVDVAENAGDMGRLSGLADDIVLTGMEGEPFVNKGHYGDDVRVHVRDDATGLYRQWNAPEQSGPKPPEGVPTDTMYRIADIAADRAGATPHRTPDTAPVDPDAAPVDPDAAPVDPDAAPVDPDAAPVDPDAAPVDPDAAPSDPDSQRPPLRENGCSEQALWVAKQRTGNPEMTVPEEGTVGTDGMNWRALERHAGAQLTPINGNRKQSAHQMIADALTFMGGRSTVIVVDQQHGVFGENEVGAHAYVMYFDAATNKVMVDDPRRNPNGPFEFDPSNTPDVKRTWGIVYDANGTATRPLAAGSGVQSDDLDSHMPSRVGEGDPVDPMREVQRYLDDPRNSPQSGQDPLSPGERDYVNALSDPLGLGDSLPGTADPLHTLADLAHTAWVRGFLDTSPEGRAAQYLRFPNDLGPLNLDERFPGERYWRYPSDPADADFVRQRDDVENDPSVDTNTPPPSLPRSAPEAIAGPPRTVTSSAPDSRAPQALSPQAEQARLLRQLGLSADQVSSRTALAETVAEQQYRTLLRAGAIEALAQTIQRQATATDPEQRAEIAAVGDHWASLLRLPAGDLTESQVETTIARLRAETLARATAIIDLADAAQAVMAVTAGPAGQLAEGESLRYTITVGGQRIPVLLVADGNGGWRVEPARPLAQPSLPDRQTSDPAQPDSRMRKLLRQLRYMFGHHGDGRPIRYALGSGNNTDYYNSDVASIQMATGHSGDHVTGLDWDPAFFLLQAKKLWSGREAFIAMIRGDYAASPRIGSPESPELPPPAERDGIPNALVPSVDDTTVHPPEDADLAAQAWVLGDAIDQRNAAGVALYQMADQLNLPLPDLSPDAVARAVDEAAYRPLRQAAAAAAFADAVQNFTVENGDLRFLATDMRNANPLERFANEMNIAQGGRPISSEPSGVQNNPTRMRFNYDLESRSPSAEALRIAYNALRRQQILMQLGSWTTAIDVDPIQPQPREVAQRLAELQDAAREMASKAAEFAELAAKYQEADSRFADLADEMAAAAGHKWIADAGGALLAPGIGLLDGDRLVVIDDGGGHDRLLADALADPRNADIAELLTRGELELEYRFAWADPRNGNLHVAAIDAPEVRHFSDDVDGRRLSVTVVRDGDGPWRVIPTETTDAPQPDNRIDVLDADALSTAELVALVEDAAVRLDVPIADLAPDQLRSTLDRLIAANNLRAVRIEALADIARTHFDIDRFTKFEQALADATVSRDELRGRPQEAIDELKQQHPSRAAKLDKLAGLLRQDPDLLDFDPHVYDEQGRMRPRGLPMHHADARDRVDSVIGDAAAFLDAARAHTPSASDPPAPNRDWVRLLGVDLENASPRESEAIYKALKAGTLADLALRTPEQIAEIQEDLRGEVRQAMADLAALEALADRYFHIPSGGQLLNHCLSESFADLNGHQGPVVTRVAVDPDRIAGVPWAEARPHFGAAKPGLFRTDSDGTGHAHLMTGLRAQGPNSTAWVLDQRTTTDEFGVGAHSYAVHYLGGDIFVVNGQRVTFDGIDDQGREWLVTDAGDRVALAELTGGTRQETANTWAVVYQDGVHIQDLGDVSAPPADDLRIGQDPPGVQRSNDPLHQVDRFFAETPELRAESGQPDPLTPAQRTQVAALSEALGLGETLAGLPDPHSALLDMAQMALARRFLDPSPDGLADQHMLFPTHFEPLTINERFLGERYWRYPSDPSDAEFIAQRDVLENELRSRGGTPDAQVPTPIPAAHPQAIAGRTPVPDTSAATPRPTSITEVQQTLLRQLGLTADQVSTPAALAETVALQRYRILLRAGAVEALDTAIGRLEAAVDPEQRTEIAAVGDTWATLLEVPPADLQTGRTAETIARLRAETVAAARAVADLADVTQLMQRPAPGPGAARRVDLVLDGERVPVRLVPDQRGGWRVEPAERLVAPQVASNAVATTPDKQPSLYQRIKNRMFQRDVPNPVHPPSELVPQGQEATLHGIGHLVDSDFLLHFEGNPALTAREVVNLWRNRQKFWNYLRGKFTATPVEAPTDRQGRPYQPWKQDADPAALREFEAELDRLGLKDRFMPQLGTPPSPQAPPVTPATPGIDNELAPPVPAAQSHEPDPQVREELDNWGREVEQAAHERETQAQALLALVGPLGIELPDLSPDSVRAAIDQARYLLMRQAVSVERLADALRRFDVENARIPFITETDLSHLLPAAVVNRPSPMERFEREVAAALRQGRPGGTLHWGGVNNNMQGGRMWWDLSRRNTPEGRQFFEDALRRHQLLTEVDHLTHLLGVDREALIADRSGLADLRGRVDDLNRAVTEIEQQASRYLDADTDFGDHVEVMADIAGGEWIRAQGGVLLDPDNAPGIGLVGDPMRLVVVDNNLEHDTVLANALADPRNADLVRLLNEGGLQVEYRVAWPQAAAVLDAAGQEIGRTWEVATATVESPQVRHFSGDYDGLGLTVTAVRYGDGSWQIAPGPSTTTPAVTSRPEIDLGTITRVEVEAAITELVGRLPVGRADLTPGQLDSTIERLHFENRARAAHIEALADYARIMLDLDEYHKLQTTLDKLGVDRDALRADPEQTLDQLKADKPKQAKAIDALARQLRDNPQLLDWDPRVADEIAGIPHTDAPAQLAALVNDTGQLLAELRYHGLNPTAVPNMPAPNHDWVRMHGVDIDSMTAKQYLAAFGKFKADKLEALMVRTPEQLLAIHEQLRAEVRRTAAEIEALAALAGHYTTTIDPSGLSAINTCVADSLSRILSDQGDVADVPVPRPGQLSGLAWNEVQALLHGARPEGFDNGRARGHADLIEALMNKGRAGAIAWVLDQRATVDQHGVGAHSYTVKYLGGNRFEVDGRPVTFDGRDASGLEWFITPDGARMALAELTGGSRTETVDTHAVVWRDGQVIENVGDRTAALPDDHVRIGRTPDENTPVPAHRQPPANAPPTVARLRAQMADALAVEAAARTEITQLEAQAQEARRDGLHERALRLEEQAEQRVIEADAARDAAEAARSDAVAVRAAAITEAEQDARSRIADLRAQLAEQLGDNEIAQFRSDLELIDNLDGAFALRDRVEVAQQAFQTLEAQIERGQAAIQALREGIRDLEAEPVDTVESSRAKQADLRTARTKLREALHTISALEATHAALSRKLPPGDLIELRAAVTTEILAATRARDAVADVFGVSDVDQLSPRYPGPVEPGVQQVRTLRDIDDQLKKAEAELDRLAERRAALAALDDLGLLPISERVGVHPAAQPSAGFPDARLVVVGSDTDVNGYRQALHAVLPPDTDLNLVLGLAKSDKVPLRVEFHRVEVDAQGRFQRSHLLPSTDAELTRRSGSWEPGKHARKWEKTRWTDPQPPFLLKFSAVPSFDKMLAGLHDFENGEVPAFVFPQNMPFAPTIYNVPEGVNAWTSAVGLDVFQARIMVIGILERLPNHPWMKNLLHNRPWIGRAILSATRWLPANTSHGKSVQLPLSADFASRHARLAWALGDLTTWIPAVRDGRWIHLVPMVRGTRTHAWFADSQPDPQSLHRADLSRPPMHAEMLRLDGTVVRPYTGESVELPEALVERWRANDEAREAVRQQTAAEYARFEHNLLHESDSFIDRIVDRAEADPDRYSGGDPKRWVRNKQGVWVRDPSGATLAKHPDGSTWLRDHDGAVRSSEEIARTLRQVRDYLLRNTELNQVADVAALWNRLIDGKPVREDIIGVEAALAEIRYLAINPEHTGQQAHEAAKKAGYDWDANRPHLPGKRTLWQRLTGRRATPLGFTAELDQQINDPAHTRRFGTTLYYGRQGFDQVRAQIRAVMGGWPESKIAEAQAQVTELATRATQSYRGDHDLARGGVHVSARVTGNPRFQTLQVSVETDGDGSFTPTHYTLDEHDNNCVVVAAQFVNAHQGDVTWADMLEPGLAGVRFGDLVPELRGAPIQGFATDETASAHARLVRGLIQAGPGTTAFVIEQRGAPDRHGAIGHAVELTYLARNPDGTHTFSLNNETVTLAEFDGNGREWFVAPVARPATPAVAAIEGRPTTTLVSLADLTGGTRADTVALWAAVWHDGRAIVIEGGDVDAPMPDADAHIGQNARNGPEQPAIPSLREVLEAAAEGASTSELADMLQGLEQQYGPYRLTDLSVRYLSSGGISVDGMVVDENGMDAGTLTEIFEIDEDGRVTVRHENLRIDEDYQGRGFARNFVETIDALYFRSGADRILITTQGDGGKFWAMADYGWNMDDPRAAAEWIKARIEQLLPVVTPSEYQILASIQQRLNGPVESYPSPREIATLNIDGRQLGDRIMRDAWWDGTREPGSPAATEPATVGQPVPLTQLAVSEIRNWIAPSQAPSAAGATDALVLSVGRSDSQLRPGEVLDADDRVGRDRVSSVPDARDRVVRWLAELGWGDVDQRHSVKLAASELVANALEHSTEEVAVLVRVIGEPGSRVVLLAVLDNNPAQPTLPVARAEAAAEPAAERLEGADLDAFLGTFDEEADVPVPDPAAVEPDSEVLTGDALDSFLDGFDEDAAIVLPDPDANEANPPTEGTRGRGLTIVAELSDGLGIVGMDDATGKAVWAAFVENGGATEDVATAAVSESGAVEADPHPVTAPEMPASGLPRGMRRLLAGIDDAARTPELAERAKSFVLDRYHDYRQQRSQTQYREFLNTKTAELMAQGIPASDAESTARQLTDEFIAGERAQRGIDRAAAERTTDWVDKVHMRAQRARGDFVDRLVRISLAEQGIPSDIDPALPAERRVVIDRVNALIERLGETQNRLDELLSVKPELLDNGAGHWQTVLNSMRSELAELAGDYFEGRTAIGQPITAAVDVGFLKGYDIVVRGLLGEFAMAARLDNVQAVGLLVDADLPGQSRFDGEIDIVTDRGATWHEVKTRERAVQHDRGIRPDTEAQVRKQLHIAYLNRAYWVDGRPPKIVWHFLDGVAPTEKAQMEAIRIEDESGRVIHDHRVEVVDHADTAISSSSKSSARQQIPPLPEFGLPEGMHQILARIDTAAGDREFAGRVEAAVLERYREFRQEQAERAHREFVKNKTADLLAKGTPEDRVAPAARQFADENLVSDRTVARIGRDAAARTKQWAEKELTQFFAEPAASHSDPAGTIDTGELPKGLRKVLAQIANASDPAAAQQAEAIVLQRYQEYLETPTASVRRDALAAKVEEFSRLGMSTADAERLARSEVDAFLRTKAARKAIDGVAANNTVQWVSKAQRSADRAGVDLVDHLARLYRDASVADSATAPQDAPGYRPKSAESANPGTSRTGIAAVTDGSHQRSESETPTNRGRPTGSVIANPNPSGRFDPGMLTAHSRDAAGAGDAFRRPGTQGKPLQPNADQEIDPQGHDTDVHSTAIDSTIAEPSGRPDPGHARLNDDVPPTDPVSTEPSEGGQRLNPDQIRLPGLSETVLAWKSPNYEFEGALDAVARTAIEAAGGRALTDRVGLVDDVAPRVLIADWEGADHDAALTAALDQFPELAAALTQPGARIQYLSGRVDPYDNILLSDIDSPELVSAAIESGPWQGIELTYWQDTEGYWCPVPQNVPLDRIPPARTGSDLSSSHPLRADYRGENNESLPIFRRVHYMSEAQREATRVFVGPDGRLYRAVDGTPFHAARTNGNRAQAGWAMFVMDSSANLYADTSEIPGILHHSSFLAGAPVSAAGSLKVPHGRMVAMDDQNGHHWANAESNDHGLRQLRAQGLVTADGFQQYDHKIQVRESTLPEPEAGQETDAAEARTSDDLDLPESSTEQQPDRTTGAWHPHLPGSEHAADPAAYPGQLITHVEDNPDSGEGPEYFDASEPAPPNQPDPPAETVQGVGEFHGSARDAAEQTLTRELALNLTEGALRLVMPAQTSWHRDGHFLLPDGRSVHLGVAELPGNAIGGFALRADGNVDLTLAQGLRNRDIPRAVAHLLTRLRQVTDPNFRHPGGRFAELKVLAGQLDQAIFDPGRAKLVPDVRQDLFALLDDLGMISDPVGDAAEQLAAFDPELSRRIGLEYGGAVANRPIFGKALTDPAFDAAALAHLGELAQALTGPYARDVLMAEALSLNARMREEQCRRMFEPMFADKNAGAVRKQLVGDEEHHLLTNDDLMAELSPLRAAFNDPLPHGPSRFAALDAAITQVANSPGIPRQLREAIDFEQMRMAARAFCEMPDRSGGVLDRTTGQVTFDFLPAHDRGTTMSLLEFFHAVDRANRGAAEHGLNIEYVVVIYDESGGRSTVDILSRPRPHYRMPAANNHPVLFAPRPSVPAAAAGGHTVDVGVGRGGFAVEMTPEQDRSGGGLVLQTELPMDYADAGQRRRPLGILDPGPLTQPGSLMVWADLLTAGDVLNAGGNGGVARFYINNVSAHFGDAEYDAMARTLPRTLAPGGRLEIQWDMKSELVEGGEPGDRGHIQGDKLVLAINRVLPPSVAAAFSVLEHTVFPHPGSAEYVFTIDAGASNVLNPQAMAKYSPPAPTDRMVIVYEPPGMRPSAARTDLEDGAQ
ncbi:hypothetical protein [Nocardia sp. NPDC049707]|uniref:hypothetical protein n=1 Tax=Nocardia sp. NPDC049707 TaxID=3154735 RepID=UPI0034491365